MSAVMELKKKELIRLKSQSSYDTTYSVATTTSTDGDNLSSDGFGSRASNSSSDCSTTPRKWRRVSIKRPTTEAHNDTASSSSFAEYEDDDEDYESDESFPDDLDSDYDKFGKAILNGNVEAVKNSILTGIDVNRVYDREQNYSFLHLACLMGQSEIVKVLVDNGAKTDSITIDGHQAIDFIEPDDLTTISYMLNKMRTSS